MLAALISSGVILLLLAVSVGQLSLDQGYTIPFGESAQDGAPASQPIPAGEAVEIILRALVALCLIALPIYIIQSLFSKKGRKRLVADIIIIGVAFLMLQCVDNQELDEEYAYQEIESEFGQSGNPFDVEVNSVGAEPIPEMPEEAPPWANTIIAILLIVFAGGAITTAYIIIRRRRILQAEENPLDRVADQAEDALRKIRAGGDFNSAILNCYYEMNRIVQEELKISRNRAMTARDFETYLVDKGLPEPPLQELTLLFERARYSNQPPNQQQEETAINALTNLISTVHDLAPKEDDESRVRAV